MPRLFLSTTTVSVVIPELGITIVHPVTDQEIDLQFSAEELGQATSLTSAINSGSLVWKKTAGGVAQTPSLYDPDYLEAEELSQGPSMLNRMVRQGDSTQFFDPALVYSVQQIGRTLGAITPNSTTKLTYLANGDLNFIEWFNSATQIVANRTARASYVYNLDLNPTTETLVIYDVDGATILRTFTWVFTYTGLELTSYTRSVT